MDIPKIYSAISNAMAEIAPIAKGQKNQSQNFMYRGIDVVMNVLQPVLIRNKLFVVPEVLEHQREERQTKSGGNLIYSILRIKYTFYADDGSSIVAIVEGEGMDSADKSSNKAMSVAFKYACFQVFCIPTEEFKDPDGDSHEDNKKKANTSAPATIQPPTKTPELTDLQLKRLFALSKAKGYTNDDIKGWLRDLYQLDTTKALTKKQYDDLCYAIEHMTQKGVE